MVYCTVLNVTLVFCRQRSHVFQWDGKSAGKWSKVDVKLELPKNTILEVEFVQELRGEVNLVWWDTFGNTWEICHLLCCMIITLIVLCQFFSLLQSITGFQYVSRCYIKWLPRPPTVSMALAEPTFNNLLAALSLANGVSTLQLQSSGTQFQHCCVLPPLVMDNSSYKPTRDPLRTLVLRVYLLAYLQLLSLHDTDACFRARSVTLVLMKEPLWWIPVTCHVFVEIIWEVIFAAGTTGQRTAESDGRTCLWCVVPLWYWRPATPLQWKVRLQLVDPLLFTFLIHICSAIAEVSAWWQNVRRSCMRRSKIWRWVPGSNV